MLNRLPVCWHLSRVCCWSGWLALNDSHFVVGIACAVPVLLAMSPSVCCDPSIYIGNHGRIGITHYRCTSCAQVSPRSSTAGMNVGEAEVRFGLMQSDRQSDVKNAVCTPNSQSSMRFPSQRQTSNQPLLCTYSNTYCGTCVCVIDILIIIPVLLIFVCCLRPGERRNPCGSCATFLQIDELT